MRRVFIYIEQYGFWWSATEAQYRAFLEKGKSAEYGFGRNGYNLDEWFRPLKGTKNKELEIYVCPLDWQQDDYEWEYKYRFEIK